MQKITKKIKIYHRPIWDTSRFQLSKDEGNYGQKQESYREKEPELDLSATFFFRIKANRIVERPEGLPPKRQAADCKADGNASVRYLERNQKSKEKKEEEGEESYRGSRPEWCSLDRCARRSGSSVGAASCRGTPATPWPASLIERGIRQRLEEEEKGGDRDREKKRCRFLRWARKAQRGRFVGDDCGSNQISTSLTNQRCNPHGPAVIIQPSSSKTAGISPR